MENQKFTELIEKRRMRAFPPPRRSDAKSSHSPVCDSFFSCLSGQNFADMSSRPTKILNISAFRDFFVTEPKCQKGAKNRVKTRFLRRISILCSSYGGGDGSRTHVRKPLDTTFFVGSLLFVFPDGGANRHASSSGSTFLPDRFKCNRRCRFTAHLTLGPGSRYSREERVTLGSRHRLHFTLSRKTQAAIATVLLSFIICFGQFSSLPGSPRLSCLRIPVETFTPPYSDS